MAECRGRRGARERLPRQAEDDDAEEVVEPSSRAVQHGDTLEGVRRVTRGRTKKGRVRVATGQAVRHDGEDP
jgi:hypothetical protein